MAGLDITQEFVNTDKDQIINYLEFYPSEKLLVVSGINELVGYYEIFNFEYKCDTSCSPGKCVKPQDASQCTACLTNFKLDTTPTGKCVQNCHASCVTCSGTLETNCLTCKTGFEIQNNATTGKCVAINAKQLTDANIVTTATQLTCGGTVITNCSACSSGVSATCALCKAGFRTVAKWNMPGATCVACKIKNCEVCPIQNSGKELCQKCKNDWRYMAIFNECSGWLSKMTWGFVVLIMTFQLRQVKRLLLV